MRDRRQHVDCLLQLSGPVEDRAVRELVLLRVRARRDGLGSQRESSGSAGIAPGPYCPGPRQQAGLVRVLGRIEQAEHRVARREAVVLASRRFLRQAEQRPVLRAFGLGLKTLFQVGDGPAEILLPEVGDRATLRVSPCSGPSRTASSQSARPRS